MDLSDFAALYESVDSMLDAEDSEAFFRTAFDLHPDVDNDAAAQLVPSADFFEDSIFATLDAEQENPSFEFVDDANIPPSVDSLALDVEVPPAFDRASTPFESWMEQALDVSMAEDEACTVPCQREAIDLPNVFVLQLEAFTDGLFGDIGHIPSPPSQDHLLEEFDAPPLLLRQDGPVEEPLASCPPVADLPSSGIDINPSGVGKRLGGRSSINITKEEKDQIFTAAIYLAGRSAAKPRLTSAAFVSEVIAMTKSIRATSSIRNLLSSNTKQILERVAAVASLPRPHQSMSAAPVKDASGPINMADLTADSRALSVIDRPRQKVSKRIGGRSSGNLYKEEKEQLLSTAILLSRQSGKVPLLYSAAFASEVISATNSCRAASSIKNFLGANRKYIMSELSKH